MKKVLLTLTAIAGLATASQAQTGFGKGDVIVEGNLNLNHENNKNTEVKTTDFNFTPIAGYFFTDKIAAGVNFNLGTSKTNEYGDADKVSRDNMIGAGLFGRYYFLELGSRFKTYAEVDADYFNTRSEVETAGNTVKGPKTNEFAFNGGIGANYFLTDKIAINFALNNLVGFSTSKTKGAESINKFGLNVNEYNNFFDAATFGLTFKF